MAIETVILLKRDKHDLTVFSDTSQDDSVVFVLSSDTYTLAYLVSNEQLLELHGKLGKHLERVYERVEVTNE